MPILCPDLDIKILRKLFNISYPSLLELRDSDSYINELILQDKKLNFKCRLSEVISENSSIYDILISLCGDKEGELDESPLALRDLERIKESFLTILAGIFHARLEYPDREEQKSSSPSEKGKTE